MEENSKEITDWQALVNKPVYRSDGKEVRIFTQLDRKDWWYHTDH